MRSGLNLDYGLYRVGGYLLRYTFYIFPKKRMPSLKRFLLNILRRIDNAIDALKFKMVKASGRGRKYPIKIATYRGFGSHHSIFLQGRVLVRKSYRKEEEKSRLDYILNTYNRFESDEVPNARLRITVGDNSYEVSTDQEGYFTLDQRLHIPLPVLDDPWYPVDIKLLETPWRKMDLTTTTSVLIPPRHAKVGIITDIDDTILHTGVTSPLKWRVIYNTFFKSASRRKVFDEAAAFFRALQQGADEQQYNPVFYVSNSPHNLYEMIKKFLKINHLPKGPVLLRDIGIPYRLHPLGYQGHKAGSITRILQTFPDIPFILVGDSGEKDAYIYHEIAHDYPERIAVIYIRDVRSPRRVRKIRRFMEDLDTITLEIFKAYHEAAQLAARDKLLSYQQFAEIRLALKEKKK